MDKTSIVYKFTGLMFLVILITVTVLLTMANLQMTSLFSTHTVNQHEGQLLNSLHNSLAYVGAIILIAGLAASYLLARRVTDPLRKLSAAAEQIGSGHYEQPILEKSNDEVGQLADSIRAMAEALQIHQRQRERLFADIAHELRTPLAVIQGNLEGMIEDVVPTDKEQLSSLLEETIHLKRLIQDLRDLSLAEAGQLRLEPVPSDMTLLIERVVVLLKPLADEKDIHLEFVGKVLLPPILIDPVRISQVINNLLINAIRYTQEHGRILVFTAVENTGDREWLVTKVMDNGSGIPDSDVAHIFDHFYRVDISRARRSGGTGIGLAIVKQLISIHGGRVTVESTPGEGSTFIIYLPLS